jgi:hypothetical protein
MKNTALCADGEIRNVYTQLSERAWDNAKIFKHHVGHIKLGLCSVSGHVLLTDERYYDKTGEKATHNLFEAYPDGVNYDLFGFSWVDLEGFPPATPAPSDEEIEQLRLLDRQVQDAALDSQVEGMFNG